MVSWISHWHPWTTVHSVGSQATFFPSKNLRISYSLPASILIKASSFQNLHIGHGYPMSNLEKKKWLIYRHMVIGPSAEVAVKTRWEVIKRRCTALLLSPTSDLSDWRTWILGFRHASTEKMHLSPLCSFFKFSCCCQVKLFEICSVVLKYFLLDFLMQ